MATLTIAVLTGRRPALLADTLASFVRHHGDVWRQAMRVVVHNSGDAETAAALDRYDWHARDVHHGGLLTIGQASQRLIRLAADSGTEHVMRLEDDWLAHPADGWLDQARALLGDVAQVRLRRADERVARRCVVCRRPIRWQDHVYGRVARDAHYTHNPTLMRTADLVALAGYRDERDAMARFHGRPIGQVEPGVFSHAGRTSLKRTEGSR